MDVSNSTNPMKQPRIGKVTVNIGIGEGGDKLQKAKKLIEKITGRTAVFTRARKREQVFKIKKGEAIGVKVTLRGKRAEDFLKDAFDAVNLTIKKSSFDQFGNFSFGVREYIDFPGVKYDPLIGLMGFDVCVSLARQGGRIEERRRKKSKIPLKHRLTKEEAIEFIKSKYKVNVLD